MADNKSRSDSWEEPLTIKRTLRIASIGLGSGVIFGLALQIACHVWHFW